MKTLQSFSLRGEGTCHHGFSLLELSVVVTVMLALMGVVAFGVSAWRESANKSTCIAQQFQMQKAMRSWQAMNDRAVGSTIASSDVIGAGRLIESLPVCRSGGSYTFLTTVPATGTPWVSCNFSGNHTPINGTTNW